MDRRQFVGRCASGSSGLAVLLASSNIAIADDKPETDTPIATSGNVIPDKKLLEAIDLSSPEVLLLSILIQRYPSDQFDESALKGILRDLRGDLARGKILSQFPLRNSDEPSADFRAYRGSVDQ